MIKTLMVMVFLLAATSIILISCGSPSGPETSRPTTRASMERGEKVYTQTCLPCHQVDGSGVSQLNPPLKNTTYGLDDESRLIGIVMNGFSDGVEINSEAYTNPMPSFGASLKDKEMADVLTYTRNSFGNKASEISAGQVKALRK